MSQQGYRQASLRAVTGRAESYEGDWHRLFDAAGIAAGPYDGRLLAFLSLRQGVAYTNLPEAMQAFATSLGATNFGSVGTFAAGVEVPPVNWTLPTVSGDAVVLETLTATAGTWGNSVSEAFQWQSSDDDGETWDNIMGETGATLALGVGQLAQLVRVTQTATNTYGETTAASAAVGPVEAA